MTGSRKLALLLASSVALNLFLLGAGTMHVVHHKKRHEHWQAEMQQRRREWRQRWRGTRPPHAPLLHKLVHAVGGPRDPRVRKLLRESRQRMKKTREEIRHAQEKVEQALVADPYDPHVLEEALAKLNARTGKAQKTPSLC